MAAWRTGHADAFAHRLGKSSLAIYRNMGVWPADPEGCCPPSQTMHQPRLSDGCLSFEYMPAVLAPARQRAFRVHGAVSLHHRTQALQSRTQGGMI